MLLSGEDSITGLQSMCCKKFMLTNGRDIVTHRKGTVQQKKKSESSKKKKKTFRDFLDPFLQNPISTARLVDPKCSNDL